MSMFSGAPMAVVMEEDIQAPFMGYDEGVEDRLSRMGVITGGGNINERTITASTLAFASNIMDMLMEYHEGDLDGVEDNLLIIHELWSRKDTWAVLLPVALPRTDG